MGLSKTRFGQVFGLTPRQVWELEAGVANPTMATLTRLAKPFGFQIGFVAADRFFGSARTAMAGLEPASPSRRVRGETVPHRLGWDGRVKPGHDDCGRP